MAIYVISDIVPTKDVGSFTTMNIDYSNDWKMVAAHVLTFSHMYIRQFYWYCFQI